MTSVQQTSVTTVQVCTEHLSYVDQGYTSQLPKCQSVTEGNKRSGYPPVSSAEESSKSFQKGWCKCSTKNEQQQQQQKNGLTISKYFQRSLDLIRAK